MPPDPKCGARRGIHASRADSLQVGLRRGGPQTVPTEIAVCPECGGLIKWWALENLWCVCESSNHAPQQTAEMLAKWNEVESKVGNWLKAQSHAGKSNKKQTMKPPKP